MNYIIRQQSDPATPDRVVYGPTRTKGPGVRRTVADRLSPGAAAGAGKTIGTRLIKTDCLNEPRLPYRSRAGSQDGKRDLLGTAAGDHGTAGRRGLIGRVRILGSVAAIDRGSRWVQARGGLLVALEHDPGRRAGLVRQRHQLDHLAGLVGPAGVTAVAAEPDRVPAQRDLPASVLDPVLAGSLNRQRQPLARLFWMDPEAGE